MLFLSSSALAMNLTPEETKDLCQKLAGRGVKDWPDFQSEQLVPAAYTFHPEDSELVCVFLDKLDKSYFYLFFVDKKNSVVFKLRTDRAAHNPIPGPAVSSQVPTSEGFDMARAKAACDVLQQETAVPPIRSRLLGFMHQMSVASEREKHGFVPGEARYLCDEYIRRKNQ